MNAFDRFVEEQMKSPTFAEQFKHEGAKIAAVDRLMKAYIGKPVPKFQVAYYLEEKYLDNRGKEKTKYIHFRGQPVGLVSNTNSGTIQDAVWSDKFNQWAYTVYPWSGMNGSMRVTEEMLVPIDEWVHSKLQTEEANLCSLLSQGSREPLSTNITSHYHSLLSGRVPDASVVIKNLKRLLKEHVDVTNSPFQK